MLSISSPARAHPRRCGDHTISARFMRLDWGSSPQVRGPRHAWYKMVERRRLIPAGAGTTRGTDSAWLSCGAHPRRCGDHDHHAPSISSVAGSSPQVRGPPVWLGGLADLRGLIPAGAGTTLLLSPPRYQRTAHPRRCGDHWLNPPYLQQATGSSPQVRGPRGLV